MPLCKILGQFKSHPIPNHNLMETRSAKRRKLLNSSFGLNPNVNEDHEVDLISNLSDDILHLILSHLEIIIIAKTSVLSKRWKQIWRTFPVLDFTTINTSNGGRYDSLFIVNQVLSQRDKNCGIRVLRFRGNLTFSCLNNLFRTAIKNNVQELDIEVTTDDYFNFPRTVLKSNSLRVLRVVSLRPGFRLPQPLILKDGLKLLTSLYLSRVLLEDHSSLLNLFDDCSFPILECLTLELCMGLKTLNVRCRSIQDLSLISCYDLKELRIEIRTLKNLRVLNCFSSYCESSFVEIDAPMLKTIHWSNICVTYKSVLKNLNFLNEAFVGFCCQGEFCLSKMKSMFQFLSGINTCHFLTLETRGIEVFWKSFEYGCVKEFSRLKSLVIRIKFKRHNLRGLAKLFECSPYVENLMIIVADLSLGRRKRNMDLWEISLSDEETFWELHSEALNSFLHHIRVARIEGFSECEDEISLVKFLLKHGKVLEEVFLSYPKPLLSKSKDSLRKEKIMSQFMGFSCASHDARIFYE